MLEVGIESNILFMKKKQNKELALRNVSALLCFLFTSTLLQLFCCSHSVMLICSFSVVCFLLLQQLNMEVCVFPPPLNIFSRDQNKEREGEQECQVEHPAEKQTERRIRVQCGTNHLTLKEREKFGSEKC